MKLSAMIISVILFCAIATGLGLVWVDFGNNYGFTVDDKFRDPYNKLNETKGFAEELEQSVAGSEIDPDANDYAIVKDTIKTAKMTRNSITWVKDILDSVSTALNIDPLWKYVAVSILILSIVFAIISMIMKKDV